MIRKRKTCDKKSAMMIRKRKTRSIHIGQVFRFRFVMKVCVLRMYNEYYVVYHQQFIPPQQFITCPVT